MAKPYHCWVNHWRLCVLCSGLAWSHLAFSQPDPSDMCSGDLDAAGCEWYQVATAYAYTGDQRTFAWVPDPDDMFRRDRMFYRVEVRSVPAEILVMTAETAVAQETIFWTPMSVGHYHLKVMACDPDLDPADQCSEWGDSMNDENTPADVPGWFVYAAIKPPTGGGIE